MLAGWQTDWLTGRQAGKDRLQLLIFTDPAFWFHAMSPSTGSDDQLWCRLTTVNVTHARTHAHKLN